MAKLSQKTILLLDKLYNLRGDDNILLQEINSKIEGINSNLEENERRREDLEREKVENQNSLLVFSNQQEAFITAFSGISDDTFAALRTIGVDVNIGTMVSSVAEKAPQYIQELNEKITHIQEEIDRDLDRKRELSEELEDLFAQRTKAEGDRDSLASLLEQCLSSDETERESLPTKYVKDILGRFGIFEADEVSTLTKLIMFPEDGLLEYDSTYEERLSKGLVGEAEDMSYDEHEDEKKDTAETYGEEPAKELGQVLERPIVITDEPEEPEVKPAPVKKAEEPAEEPREKTSILDLTALNVPAEEPKEPTIQEYLESIGLDLEIFREENDKESNIEKLMAELTETDRTLIATNYEILRSLNAEIAAYRYRRNHSYLSDNELTQKVTLLRARGISEKKIRELLEQADSGLRESLETIQARMEVAEELGTPVTDEHAELLGKDLRRLAENIRALSENEITLDDKERRNYQYILTESGYVRADLEVLKNYLINITRSNDKYALNVFTKDPYDLITDIDNIIENNLEDVLSTNPEVLCGRNGAFVDRVRYFEGLGKPIVDTTGRNAYASYILNPLEALRENGNKPIPPVAPTEEEVNRELPSIIGNANTTSGLVDILTAYYKDRTDFGEIELSDVATEGYARLLEQFETAYHAERIGKYTFKVGESYISKPKLERHIGVLVSALEKAGESIDGIENEILLTAMLYNLRQDEKALAKLVETCLGFNEENTLGGRTL